jgi:hypothetical protein
MVKCSSVDHGLDPGRAQLRDLVFVVRPGRLVPPPLRGLETAPLDGEAVRIGAEIAEEADVLGHPVPVIGGRTALLVVADVPRGRFEPRPVVAVVPALDLMRGGGRPPEKGRGRRRGEGVVRNPLELQIRRGEVERGNRRDIGHDQQGARRGQAAPNP